MTLMAWQNSPTAVLISTVFFWIGLVALALFLWLSLVGCVRAGVEWMYGSKTAVRVAKGMLFPIVLPIVAIVIVFLEIGGTWHTVRRVWWSCLARTFIAFGVGGKAVWCAERALKAAGDGVTYWRVTGNAIKRL